ncbi:MAG: methionyl-tRNA formyltransferase [Lachnospiraceae bacterium]|nr:methionyl-tRNA formyltransferase [Lachnospiraceae bacterium]
MRILFMGTPDFSVPVLTGMIEEGYDVVGVVTQPDKPKGRGKGLSMPPVKEVAIAHDIPVYQPKRVRDPAFIEVLKEIAPDLIVVVAFGQILSKAVLDVPRLGCINVHASLLPKYRGAAPIQWAVINGEKETGVTTMMMDEGLDTGDMLLSAKVELAPDETGGSLHDKLSVLGRELLLETLKELEAGTLKRTRQDDSQTGEYAKMLKKEMGEIDFNEPAVKIERLIRGLNPWPSAYTHCRGKIIKIWRAEAVETDSNDAPGTVIACDKKSFTVKCGEGALRILELQPESKKCMEANAFLCGTQLKPGCRLE